MAYDIHEKVNKLFSDELNVNKKLLFSPKKKIQINFNKNLQGNQFSLLGQIEKSMGNIDNIGNSHNNKNNKRKISQSNKHVSPLYSNHVFNSINNNKSISHLTQKNINKKIEIKKENENNNEDDDFLFNAKLQYKRPRGKSYHIKNEFGSACFKGILSKDSKKLKKPKFDLKKENENNLKIEEKKEEEEELKKHEEDKSILKEKKKNNNINNNISFSMNKVKKNRLNIEINKDVNDIKKNKSINDSLNIEENQSPKSKSKKKKKKKDKIAKCIKSELKEKNSKQKLKRYNSIVNKNKTISPLIKGKKNDEQISSYTSSKMSGVSNSYLDSNDIKKKKSEKENNNKDNDSEASFQSSYFSNDSQSNDDIIIHKKIIPKSYKSSKCIKYYNHIGSNNSNNKNKKSSNKKLGMYENYNKNNNNMEFIHENKEESKSSSKFIDKIEDETSKVKSFKLDDNSELKLKRGSSKRKVSIPSQYQITKKENNLFILPEENSKNFNENKNINHNMNIVSPGNIISIEYNINHAKKNEKNLQVKNNEIIINNNESNNITCYKKIPNKNNINEIEDNQYQRKMSENENDNIINNNNGYNEFIFSRNNIIRGKKKPKRSFCFCFL